MTGYIAKSSPPLTKVDCETTREIADELAQADADYAARATPLAARTFANATVWSDSPGTITALKSVTVMLLP
jgi:hypothetical protein